MNATTAPVSPAISALVQSANWSRYRLGQAEGHYESLFLRANHPSRPLAFWIRYTLFNPDKHPEQAVGELWAVCFDGEKGRNIAVRQETPLAGCTFERERFGVEVGGASLGPGALRGHAESSGRAVAWDLRFTGDLDPIFLLPAGMYAASLPRAKSLVGLPMACFNGTLSVAGEQIAIENWVGSQNHNWGERHTDRYAWGQVAGFDNAPGSFLEIATAILKMGPIWAPPVTPIVLRHEGREYLLNDLKVARRTKAFFGPFKWVFGAATKEISISGTISAPREAFVQLAYRNPPGGTKYCLNTKLAKCEVMLTFPSGERTPLLTEHRAAFEMLTDGRNPGVAVLA